MSHVKTQEEPFSMEPMVLLLGGLRQLIRVMHTSKARDLRILKYSIHVYWPHLSFLSTPFIFNPSY